MHAAIIRTPIARLLAGLIFAVFAFAAPTTGDTTPELTPYKASYSASISKGVSLNGAGVRELSSQGNGVWLYQTDVKSFIADIDESLTFRWEHGQVIPLRYNYRLSGFLVKEREQEIRFDWDKRTASGHYRGRKFEVELRDNTLDPLGLQLQLQQDLIAGKHEVTYQVLDKGRFDEDHFAVIAEDTETPGTNLNHTVKVEKVRSDESRRQTLMWFDPKREYTLLRLLQIEPDGSEYELKLNSAKIAR